MGQEILREERVRETNRMPKTFLLIILSITLRNCQPIIDIIQKHPIIRYIPDQTPSTSSRQTDTLFRVRVWPDFDACALGGIEHADVADEDIFYVVDAGSVLAQGTDGDAVGAVANEVLDEDGCAVWFEGDAVCEGVSGEEHGMNRRPKSGIQKRFGNLQKP